MRPKFQILLVGLCLQLSGPLSAQSGPGYATLRQHDGFGDSPGYVGEAISSAGGDMDGDGVGDYLISEPFTNANGFDFAGLIWARSGATGAVIRSFEGPAYLAVYGRRIAGIGDINFDGISDLVVMGGRISVAWSGSAVEVISGADGSLIYFYDGVSNLSAMGESVAAGGDINNDGVPDFLIGEHRADQGGGSVGSAYAYSGLDGSLLHRFDGQTLNCNMGLSVACAGDVNNDSYDDIIVGAPSTHNSPGDYVGAAFVYSGFDGSQLYRFDGTDFQESMGFSVSGLGDVDQDGYDDFLIGSPGANGSTFDEGAGSVYSGRTGALIYRFYGITQQGMGKRVGRAGDVNGDGVPDILVSSDSAGPALDYSGNAWVYSGSDGALLHHMHGPNAGDYLGSAVCGIGDINEDGAAEILVGSSRYDFGGAVSAGTVYVLGMDPHLRVSNDNISNAVGAVMGIDLDFPLGAALYEYRILMSLHGRGPVTYGGVTIPLSADSFAFDSYNGIYPFTTHSNLHGLLDGNGDASASITFPAGAYGFAVGRTMWLAGIASQVGGAPEFTTSSVAVTMLD